MNLDRLQAIDGPTQVSGLDRETLTELQRALGRLGHPVGGIDGAWGEHTQKAWAAFEKDVFGTATDLIDPPSVAALQVKVDQAWAAEGDDFSTRDGTIAAIRRLCGALGIGSPAQVAYVLATVEWESAHTFRPVREGLDHDDAWRKRVLARYYPYYGRGYVQLTWDRNYKAYGELLDLDLPGNPDLALDPAVASFVLVHGFRTGFFTGKKLADFVNDRQTDFPGARKCINGTDRQHEIAKIAQGFLTA